MSFHQRLATPPPIQAAAGTHLLVLTPTQRLLGHTVCLPGRLAFFPKGTLRSILSSTSVSLPSLPVAAIVNLTFSVWETHKPS